LFSKINNTYKKKVYLEEAFVMVPNLIIMKQIYHYGE